MGNAEKKTKMLQGKHNETNNENQDCEVFLYDDSLGFY
jgi:hypothetical protein